ncbi:MAG: hypothetical protein RR390_17945, partial [Hafnia sp.]
PNDGQLVKTGMRISSAYLNDYSTVALTRKQLEPLRNAINSFFTRDNPQPTSWLEGDTVHCK